MILFFKNTSIPSLKLKLTFIYILNALDILFTFSLLKTGLFREVNVLMLQVVDNALLSIFIKLVLPALLIIYILIKLDELIETQLPLCNLSINIVFIIYSAILLMHLGYTLFFAYTLLFPYTLF